MKIFYWDQVLADYTYGMMVAVAEDVDSARAALLLKCPHIPDHDLFKEPQVFEIEKPWAETCWGGG